MPSDRMSERLRRLGLFIRGSLFAPEVREHLLRQEVELILKHLDEENEEERDDILGQIRAYGLGHLLDS